MAGTKTPTPGATFKTTAPITILYPKELFEPKPKFKGKGDLVFGGTFVFDGDHPDLPAIRALISKLANDARPGVEKFRSPLKSGTKLMDKNLANDKEKYNKYKATNDFQRGKAILTPRSKMPPELGVYIKGQGWINLTNEALKAQYKDRFYFGAEAYATFFFSWYNEIDEDSKPGVVGYVNTLGVTGAGKRIGSQRVSAAEAFSGYSGNVSDVDPLAGAPADDEDDSF